MAVLLRRVLVVLVAGLVLGVVVGYVAGLRGCGGRGSASTWPPGWLGSLEPSRCTVFNASRVLGVSCIVDVGAWTGWRPGGLVLSLPGLRLSAALPSLGEVTGGRLVVGIGYIGGGAGEAVVEAMLDTTGGPVRAMVYTNVNMSPRMLGGAVERWVRLVERARGEAPLLIRIPRVEGAPYLVAVAPSGCSLEARLGLGPSPASGYVLVAVEPGGMTSQPPPGKNYSAVIPLWRSEPGGGEARYSWVMLRCRNGYKGVVEARVYETRLYANLALLTEGAGPIYKIPVLVLPTSPPPLLR